MSKWPPAKSLIPVNERVGEGDCFFCSVKLFCMLRWQERVFKKMRENSSVLGLILSTSQDQSGRTNDAVIKACATAACLRSNTQYHHQPMQLALFFASEQRKHEHSGCSTTQIFPHGAWGGTCTYSRYFTFGFLKYKTYKNSWCQGMYNRSHQAIAVAMECQGVLTCLYYVLLHYCTSWLAINGSPGTLDTFILMFILCNFLYSEASYWEKPDIDAGIWILSFNSAAPSSTHQCF